MKGAKTPIEPKPLTKKRPPMIQKMLDDKASVEAYYRGELSLEDLHERGIRFGKLGNAEK